MTDSMLPPGADPAGGPAPTPPAAAPAPDAAPAETAARRPPSAGMRNLALILVPMLCLAATAVMYVRLSGDLADLQASQKQLVDEVASLRRTPMIDVANAPMRGGEGAVVTMIEYSDYECPFCIKYFREVLPRIENEYIATGKIRYVFRDFPVDQLHPAAIRAHAASRCAREQDKFWQMHGRLFSAPGTHSDEALIERAREIALDLTAFADCLGSGRTIDDIRKVSEQAISLGASGTPAFFLGLYDPSLGQVRILRGISGAQPFEVFQQTIEALLEQVK
jgi:protein-disulfide isomerase